MSASPQQRPTAAVTTTATATTASPPMKVQQGLLTGLLNPNGTRTYLGIPYAAPPTGPLRWRPPQPPSPWSGIRTATTYGPSAMQYPPPAKSIYSGGETSFSEDCLYLNVWTGDEGSRERPVLVWFHMGAFVFGSGSAGIYNGDRLVEKGVTVVTVNYRLGRFGFLAHPELSQESGRGVSGNWGIMDQIAALEWVQGNIGAFGGDAGNVTIGGASAGGGSVQILRASPLAREGLFQRVVCESGSGMAPLVGGDEKNKVGHVAGFLGLAAAEEAGVELCGVLGVRSVEELRGLAAEKIVGTRLERVKGVWRSRAWSGGGTSLSLFDGANPVVDGYVLPESPIGALLSWKMKDVPMLAGNVGNEASGMPYLGTLDDYHTHVQETFKERAEEVDRLYPARTNGEAQMATNELLGDQVFLWPTWTSARLQAKNLKAPAWYYRFLRAPSIPSDSDVIEKEYAGAYHGAGVPYLFGNLDAREWDWTEADRALSKRMMEALVRFVRDGNPEDGSEGAELWPALKGGSGDLVKVWDTESRVEPVGSRLGEMAAFWDGYYDIAE